MQRVRVGVVGLGQIAQIMHLPYLHSIQGFDVAAVCDLSPTLVEQVGTLYHVDGRYTQPADMIAQEDLDAVVICSSFDHADIARTAIEHGKHVLVEKPLCEHPAVAREIAKAGDKAGVTVMVGYMKRYDPGFRRWQEQIQNLDNIRLVRVHDFCHDNNRIIQDAYDLAVATDIPQEAIDGAHARRTAQYRRALGGEPAPHILAGYGLMLGLGVHDMTILRGSFGDPEAVLFADITTDEPTVVVAILDYGSFRCTWEIGSTTTKHFDEELAVWTPDEILKLQFPSPYLRNAPTTLTTIRTVEEETITTTTTASVRESFHAQLLHFYECILHDRRPHTDAWDAVRDLELLLEIVQQAR